MIDVPKILDLAKKQTGVDFLFMRNLGNGFNNQALLLQDKEGREVVVKYSLSDNTKNPFIKIFYKFKKVRRQFLINNYLFNLSKKDLLYIKENYRNNDYEQTIQNIARIVSDSVYVPVSLDFSEGGRHKLTFEEYCGKPLTNEFSDEETAPAYAKDLAKFLADLHNVNEFPPRKEPLYQRFLGNLRVANLVYKLKKWKSSEISSEVLSNLESSLQALKQMGNEDEIRSILHNDLRKPNILKSDDGKLSIIDWESAGINNIYYEFIQFGSYTNGLPLKFIKDVVQNYNTMANHKIDLNKLKHLLVVWYVSECSRRSVISRKSRTEFLKILNTKVVSHLNKIHQVFGDGKQNEVFSELI